MICEMGRCGPKPLVLPGERADGGDAGITPMRGDAEAGVADTGWLDAGDTGPIDAADAAPTDQGSSDAGEFVVYDSGFDAGRPDAFIPDAFGLAWLGELKTTPPEFIAYAQFTNPSGASYTEVSHGYDPTGVDHCTLSERRLASGQAAGYAATEVTFRAGQNPHNPSAISLTPVGASGYYQYLGAPLTAGLFSGAGQVGYQITGTAANPMTLGNLMVTGGVPPELSPILPAQDTEVSAGRTIELQWVPSGGVVRRVAIELRDQARAVVLACQVQNDGQFTLPEEARLGWLGARPTAPATLEIRFDEEVRRDVPLGGGGSLPVTFRASQGARWRVGR